MSSVIVDTNIWINHFKNKNSVLEELLTEDRVVLHPFILGELACGNLDRRAEILELFSWLPKSEILSEEEVLSFLASEKIYGKGLGWIDVHLLGAARISRAQLWTLDKALLKEAKRFSINFN
ncbi:MAG: PIN domain-containing protein [Deltaproteobacteria bacterium]|nr:PIN domain-containing protein [Deltaproteobacteria bacterium]